jgi:hypothetical protein
MGKRDPRRRVFHRQSGRKDAQGNGAGIVDRLRAALGGTVTVAPGVDLTEPTGEVWDAEGVEAVLRAILSKFVGAEPVRLESQLYQQLGIAGDDAAELLEEVRARFGTAFAGFRFYDFFPDETEALAGHLARLAHLRSRKKPFTFAHLMLVVEQGHWSDP